LIVKQINQTQRTEGITPDLLLNRAEQTRRDDDVIRSAKRTIYDIDYAIKWYIENEIQPQIIATEQNLTVPVIFAAGEKWDNVRRLGYLRDEKGMLQSPMIMLNETVLLNEMINVHWMLTDQHLEIQLYINPSIMNEIDMKMNYFLYQKMNHNYLKKYML
jgi:glutaredoxin